MKYEKGKKGLNYVPILSFKAKETDIICLKALLDFLMVHNLFDQPENKPNLDI